MQVATMHTVQRTHMMAPDRPAAQRPTCECRCQCQVVCCWPRYGRAGTVLQHQWQPGAWAHQRDAIVAETIARVGQRGGAALCVGQDTDTRSPGQPDPVARAACATSHRAQVGNSGCAAAQVDTVTTCGPRTALDPTTGSVGDRVRAPRQGDTRSATAACASDARITRPSGTNTKAPSTTGTTSTTITARDASCVVDRKAGA